MAVLSSDKHNILNQLKKDILRLEGFNPPKNHHNRIGIGPVEKAFPNGIFPSGAIHEFVSTAAEQDAASCGFICSLLAKLLKKDGICVWISMNSLLFPPALSSFGLTADRIVFVQVQRHQDVLWAMEEALKCKGLMAVVAEGRELDFAQSRRLQLAVEKSKVTGFILRNTPRKMGATACVARWRITPIPSELEEGMPGLGFPRWEVELLKVRNGSPGKWRLEWSEEQFIPFGQQIRTNSFIASERKIG